MMLSVQRMQTGGTETGELLSRRDRFGVTWREEEKSPKDEGKVPAAMGKSAK